MNRIVITLCPRNDLLIVRRIRINADYDLRPVGIAIIPGSLIFAYARGRAVNWIHVHLGMHGWKGLAEADVLRNRVVAQLIDEIGAPVPLESRRIQRVEHALQRRLWNRAYKIESRFLESAN